MTEDEMDGQFHRSDQHKSDPTPGGCGRQEGLACSGPGGHEESFRPLSSPSPLALTVSQHQDLFQGFFSSHEMAKVLEPQLEDLSFQ